MARRFFSWTFAGLVTIIDSGQRMEGRGRIVKRQIKDSFDPRPNDAKVRGRRLKGTTATRTNLATADRSALVVVSDSLRSARSVSLAAPKPFAPPSIRQVAGATPLPVQDIVPRYCASPAGPPPNQTTSRATSRFQ